MKENNYFIELINTHICVYSVSDHYQDKLKLFVGLYCAGKLCSMTYILVPSSSMMCSAVQCSAVQGSAFRCSSVQYSAVQCCAVPCSAVSTVQWSAVHVHCSGMKYNVVYCNNMLYSARLAVQDIQCSAVQFSAVHPF